MQNLLNLPAQTPGIRGLKSFSDTIESNIRELERLGRYQESYGSLSLSLVQQLRLYFDENGIIRCKGRIQNSSIEENAKFHILLPKNHTLTDFVIMDAHLGNLNEGVGQTITHIRQSYWIPQFDNV